ncbi:S41 family peptidase [Thermopetrobacter sp. TC1]|uniref:S41 family peptidase n=1 Tax=Thermopetrobacter sp. TC1 TaxID=1495045 RepID=UPI000B32055A
MKYLRPFSYMALGALMMIGVWQALHSARAGEDNLKVYRQLDLFGDVFDRVRANYVEKPDEEKLVEAAINGMLQSLDPHSSYLNPKNFRDMQVQTRGEFGGLGIEVTMENGVIKVVSPIDDTPAARAGIMAGDYIIKIDGKSVQGMTLNQAVEKMRGKVGTPITITVLRKGRKKPFDVKIIRDIIRIKSVKHSIEGGDIGYIRITSFNEQTGPGLEEAIKDIKKKLGDKVKGYIIDLRNNPGGLLDQAIQVADDFLEHGEIVSTRGRTEQERYNATPGDLTDGKPIVVLINGGSASASEIVAGALQDHKRATIIGTRSFGKGSVQTIIPLGPRGGAIRLTTARYYTPKGRSIQAKGIEPDYVIEEELPPELKDKIDQLRTRGEAALPGHLKNDKHKGKEESGSLAYVPKDKAKDTQLQAAIKFLHGQDIAMMVKKPAAKEKDTQAKASEKPASREAQKPAAEKKEAPKQKAE